MRDENSYSALFLICFGLSKFAMFQILQAQDMEEELELEGRPSRFNRALLETSYDNDSANNDTEDVERHKRKKSQKWRKTGIKSLSTDFRDTF